LRTAALRATFTRFLADLIMGIERTTPVKDIIIFED
jgi:hypothetical protein